MSIEVIKCHIKCGEFKCFFTFIFRLLTLLQNKQEGPGADDFIVCAISTIRSFSLRGKHIFLDLTRGTFIMEAYAPADLL